MVKAFVFRIELHVRRGFVFKSLRFPHTSPTEVLLGSIVESFFPKFLYSTQPWKMGKAQVFLEWEVYVFAL